MDGVLLIHAKSGHVLLTKAYSESYGLELENANKDPTVAAMLLANFLCAVYTNLTDIVNESVVPPSDSSLQELMRNPLQSFDTGSSGPILFFRRDAPSNVLCALFLKRSLIAGADDAALATFHACGEWLAEQVLHSFVSTFSADLAAKPFRASTKVFKPFVKTLEELYTSAFSQLLVHTTLSHLAARWAPPWMYVIHSEAFLRGMEASQQLHQRPAVGLPRQPSAPARVADVSLESSVVPAFVPRPPSTPAPPSAALASASARSPSSFVAARPMIPRGLHPFRPPVRRWWQFGTKKEPTPLFYAQLGRTVLFYSFQDEKGCTLPHVALRDEGCAHLPAADGAPSVSPSVSPALLAAPSPEALHKLVALVHAAGLVLSGPTEVSDALRWMEATLAPSVAPSAKGAPAAPPATPVQKLWVLRVQDLLLCFPTPMVPAYSPSTDSSSASSVSCSFPELLSSLQPFLECLSVHYAFVAEVHERNYRALQKSMEKQAAAKK